MEKPLVTDEEFEAWLRKQHEQVTIGFANSHIFAPVQYYLNEHSTRHASLMHSLNIFMYGEADIPLPPRIHAFTKRFVDEPSLRMILAREAVAVWEELADESP